MTITIPVHTLPVRNDAPFMGGHVHGVVTQLQPPKKLIYTWNVFDPNDGPDAASASPESYLTFELEPQEGNEVTLTLHALPHPRTLRPAERDGLAHHAGHSSRGT